MTALPNFRAYEEPVQPFATDHPGCDHVAGGWYYTAFACIGCGPGYVWLDARPLGDPRPIRCRQCQLLTGIPVDLYMRALDYPDC